MIAEMRLGCRRWIVTLLLCCGLAVPCLAQTGTTTAPAPQPAAAASPASAGTSTAPRASDDMMGSNSAKIIDAAGMLTDALQPIFAAAPHLPEALGALRDRIAASSGGSIWNFILKLGAVFAGALVVLELVRLALGAVRRRHVTPSGQAPGVGDLLTILGADLLGILAMLAVTYVAHMYWFSDDSIASEIAEPLIAALVYWRLMLVPVDLVLRHREAGARLVGLSDRAARHLREGASALVALQVFSTALMRGFFHSGVEIAGVRFLALCLGVVNAALALYLIRRVRRATRGGGEAGNGAVTTGTSSAFFQRIWHPLALAFVGLALLAWTLGVIFRNLRPFWGAIDTAGILVGIWLLDVMIGAWLDRISSRLGDGEGSERRRAVHHVIRHCLDVALWLGAAGILIELWMVRLARILPSEGWERFRGSVGTAIATIYVAYVLWQVVFMHTERHIRAPIAANSGGSDAPPIASRLQTVLPILRVFMLVTIAVLAGLIALANLGVNTTSLIAGASIFGLAISFGSQSLVRDIVSGIFFMADDAFRIGEYIDSGKLKGTVEGMSIRSLRLRHQNGQIHVIPFGTIQHVTNFSRDWTTVKFNLQLAHDTDLEQVRKAVKQIGIEMMSDPELTPELIAPLKMQGMTEIGPTAVVVRFKFTARPVQPTFVYRAALKRIYKTFREKGIEFANPTVFVQSRSAEETPSLEAMAAAATAKVAPPTAAD
jgi:moderate conductance mechanosensitive channel